MAGKTEIQKLIENNPGVDTKQLQQLHDALLKMRSMGKTGSKYKLASPIDRHRVTVLQAGNSKPGGTGLDRDSLLADPGSYYRAHAAEGIPARGAHQAG